MHDDVVSLLAHCLGHVYFLPKKLMLYRQHASNITGNIDNSIYSYLRRAFDSKLYVLSAIHYYKEKESFLKAYKDDLDTEARQIFTAYLEFPKKGLCGRLCLFVWLAVGSFDIPKDYPNLLHALGRVPGEFNNALLLIAGDGPLRPDMEKLTSKLGLDKQVRFLGICHNIPELMNAANAFALSSRWEGFGLVLAEAMSCQLPVVATDSDGPREILNGGTLGFLVPPGDSEALATAMAKMMALSEAERRAMGKAGRAHIKANYNLERVVDQWEGLYMEFLQKKGVSLSGSL